MLRLDKIPPRGILKSMSAHPCHQEELPRLKRVKGQLEGVMRMIEAGRYCPDILMQMRAARAALRRIEAGILQKHLKHCVAHALKEGDSAERKLEELIKIFDRYDD